MKQFKNHKLNVVSTNKEALFTMKLHRGDGMTLIGLNWKEEKPPIDFVGFAIEYMVPGGKKFLSIPNRIGFLNNKGLVDKTAFSSLRSPIQKFRWVHFPWNADLPGLYTYRVTPVFMNAEDELSYGEPQKASIELRRETFPSQLNVTYTRGFVSSQAFVDKYVREDYPMDTLIPSKSSDGLTFKPTHPKAEEAYRWMGFEAREVILETLDNAIKNPKAKVYVIAYDLSEPEIVNRLKRLKTRLRIIIDNSGDHGKEDSGESQAARILINSAGENNVIRQKMGKLQHNKTIVVEGPRLNVVVCGSTNFTWRGFLIQSNNALILYGRPSTKVFIDGFENYWNNDNPQAFGATASSKWLDLKLKGIDAKVIFSPRYKDSSVLENIADDILTTQSCLFYSLAFLYQTPGRIIEAIKTVTNKKGMFVYGISDKKVGGIDLQKPDGNTVPVYPAALTGNIPEPFKSEPTGLSGNFGNRMHHKFIVIDFNKPSARVYLGSYNFSGAADNQNGENLLLIKNPKVAVSYTIEALRIFDHYHFRIAQADSKKAKTKLSLKKPPKIRGEKPWWDEDYRNPVKIRDRELFS